MHMNKFYFPGFVDIRSRLSCCALLCLEQNRLLWCTAIYVTYTGVLLVRQYSHIDGSKSYHILN